MSDAVAISLMAVALLLNAALSFYLWRYRMDDTPKMNEPGIDWSKLDTNPKDYKMLELPEQSDWICHLFGSKGDGFCYNPLKGCEPNWFVRWMMKICFACTWEKRK